MSDNITNYGVNFQFGDALKGLKKLKTEFASLNKMQSNLNAQRVKMQQMHSNTLERQRQRLVTNTAKTEAAQRVKDTGQFIRDRKAQHKAVEVLEKKAQEDSIARKKAVAKVEERERKKKLDALVAERKLTQAQADKLALRVKKTVPVTEDTKPRFNPVADSVLGKKLQQRDKTARNYQKRQDARSAKENFKHSIKDLTKADSKNELTDYYKQLSKEADSHYKKVNQHQEKQKQTALDFAKAERKSQEALGASMNKDANKKIRDQETLNKQLAKARELALGSNTVQGKHLTKEQQIHKAKFKTRIEMAKTVQEIRNAVREEKQLLRVTKKRSFLQERMRVSGGSMVGNMVSAYAIASVGNYITESGQDFERAENTLTAITGTAEKAAKEMEYLKDITYKMGIPLKETAKDYSKLMASAEGLLGRDQLKGLFEDLTKASVVLGTTSDDQGLVFKALTQMLSKQKVSAEEYRGQLGERMPIAIQAMGKAAVKAGLVTDEMLKKFGSASGAVEQLMKDGKLYAKDVLPFFGKEIAKIVDPGFSKALESNLNAMGRMQNTMESTAAAIFKSGWEEGLTDLFNSLGAGLKDNELLFTRLGKIVGQVFKGIAWSIDNVISPAMGALGSIMNSLIDVFGETKVTMVLSGMAILKIVKMLTGAFGVMGVSVNAALWPIVGTLAAIAAGLMLLEEVAEFISPTGKKSGLREYYGIEDKTAKEKGGFLENPNPHDKVNSRWEDMKSVLSLGTYNKKLKDGTVSETDGIDVAVGRLKESLSRDWAWMTGSSPNPLSNSPVKPQPQPIVLNNQQDLYLDGELAARAFTKTETFNNTIDGRIADYGSYNH